MPDAHANFSTSTVLTAPSPATSGTTVVVQSGDGAKFPTAPYNCVICPVGQAPTTTNAEVVRVTLRATDTLTITRAQEGSSARTVVVGDQIYAAITSKTLTDTETQINGTTVPLTGSAWIAPTLGNSWVNVGGTAATAGYFKDPIGFVHLRGRIMSGASGSSPFTLPAGYRPGSGTDYYAAIQGGILLGAAVIPTTGVMLVYTASGTSPVDISLGGITFLAEN